MTHAISFEDLVFVLSLTAISGAWIVWQVAKATKEKYDLLNRPWNVKDLPDD